MNFSKKVLFISVIVVWLTVFLLDDGIIPKVFAKGGGGRGGGGGRSSSGRSSSGSRGSIRSSIGKAFSSTGRIRASIRKIGSSSSKSSASSISSPVKPMHYIPEVLYKPKLSILSNVAAKMGTKRLEPNLVVVPIVVSANNYNGYNYRQSFNQTIGETCENNLDFNGIVFGKFICPIEGFDILSVYCCGNQFEEYCCSEKDLVYEDETYLKPFYNETNIIDEDSSTGWTFFGYFFAFIPICCVFIAIFFVIKKLRDDLSF